MALVAFIVVSINTTIIKTWNVILIQSLKAIIICGNIGVVMYLTYKLAKQS